MGKLYNQIEKKINLLAIINPRYKGHIDIMNRYMDEDKKAIHNYNKRSTHYYYYLN